MKIPYGVEFLGTDKIETSTANQEVLPTPPSEWTTGHNLYKFSFRNDQATNVIINGKTNIHLKEGQGFESGINDPTIRSFVIVNAGVKYQWIGAY